VVVPVVVPVDGIPVTSSFARALAAAESETVPASASAEGTADGAPAQETMTASARIKTAKDPADFMRLSLG